MDTLALDAVLLRLARSSFRARFHLRGGEQEYVRSRGMATVRCHAQDFIGSRLAPARPAKDGQQTPWGGHPVFRGQHATATCCRTCLERNHGFARGQPLTQDQQAYILDLLCRWIERQAAVAGGAPGADHQSALF
ncbi:DUF4186 family protein [Brevibacterium sp. 5221]|uniref:DUF4186 family protein n=1 Tax=Brevibacterium rongguiense TaxID=2695267 RepID=A0A6N9H5V1_9MICO|nr:DUF4186 domain-containing protein [Brevibacterium rongguiense]MYM19004.1 DUF4186 family protein [Brevibacterium rongguiense]